MKRWAIVCCLLLASFCSVSWAFDVSPTQVNEKPDFSKVKVSPEAWDAVLANGKLADSIDLYTVTRDGKRMSAIRGRFSQKLEGSLDKAAREFIFANAQLFNLPPTKDENILRLSRLDSVAGGEHVSYQMCIDGVLVRNANIEIHSNSEREVRLINGSFPKIKKITNQITLGQNEAIAAARQAIGADTFRCMPKAELMIQPTDENGRMVFLVRLAAEEPLGDWEVVIDADNGRELERTNQMNFANDPASRDTGLGAVYFNHPLISKVTQESLYNLTTHNLIGKYAKVINEDVAEALNEEDVHIYDPADTHFDEAMMYFQLNRIHDFFKGLGFNKLDTPMQATVHYGTNYDNAYFSPWMGGFAFGDGNKFNDLAREESIAFHEYSHGVINRS